MGDPADTKSSELDRRLSRAASTRLSHILREGDDDDYDLQAMAISDGFRPTQSTQSHQASHVARPSQSSLDMPAAGAMPSRPSSVAKPVPGHDFSGPYNASNALERGPMRSSSMSTDTPVMSAETPYEGPRGPSHPYQMYPQDVRLARTASLATTSTAPISERSYNGPRGPTHAYGLYPQNVGTIDDVPGNRTPQGGINVGFPGTPDNYQRRLGPDGEEVADMIGPDGHTEQLPPYTRYPEEAYAQKAAGINITQPEAASSSSTAQTDQQAPQNLAIPGAGGIGLATRNPEFSSTEDLHQLNSPQSRHSVRSMVSEVSHHSINTAALAVTNEKNWKTAARRKVWGVFPCWALILGAIILVLLGVILGTVIGTVFGRQLSDKNRHDDSFSATKPPGFVPLASVPPGLPALVEGPYSLPLMSPRFSNTCFKDTSQGRAWNCDAIMAQLTMSIRRKSDSTDVTAYALDLNYNHSYTTDSNVYSYGVQPPSLTDQQMELVDDTFEPSRGPAWALALPYEKTVILPEQFLSYSDGDDQAQRRSMFGFDFKRKGLAQSGEKPWICTWPSTILEILIYPSQNNTYTYAPHPSSTGGPSSSPLPTSSSGGGHPDKRSREAIGPFDFDDYDSRKEEDYSHTGSEEHTSSSSTVPSGPLTSLASPTSSAPNTASDTSSAERNYFSPPPMPPPPFPPYPKIVKVEERREPEIGAGSPTCRQIEVGEKGVEALPVLNETGEPIVIQIEEIMEETSKKEIRPYYKRRSFGPSMWQRDDGSELSDCGCIWWLT